MLAFAYLGSPSTSSPFLKFKGSRFVFALSSHAVRKRTVWMRAALY
jgi:hypothetical protein